MGVSSSLPPGSQAENQKQMGRSEASINNYLNACSLQKASHRQISARLAWSSVSEESPVITLQPNKSLETQVQTGTTCVS